MSSNEVIKMGVNYGGKSFAEAAQNRYRPVIEMYISGLFESHCQLKSSSFHHWDKDYYWGY